MIFALFSSDGVMFRTKILYYCCTFKKKTLCKLRLVVCQFCCTKKLTSVRNVVFSPIFRTEIGTKMPISCQTGQEEKQRLCSRIDPHCPQCNKHTLFQKRRALKTDNSLIKGQMLEKPFLPFRFLHEPFLTTYCISTLVTSLPINKCILMAMDGC